MKGADREIGAGPGLGSYPSSLSCQSCAAGGAFLATAISSEFHVPRPASSAASQSSIFLRLSCALMLVLTRRRPGASHTTGVDAKRVELFFGSTRKWRKPTSCAALAGEGGSH